MALGNSRSITITVLCSYVGWRWVLCLQLGKVFCNKPRPVFTITAGQSFCLWMHHLQKIHHLMARSWGWPQFPEALLTITEYCLLWWWRKWCIPEKIALFTTGNFWVLNLKVMQDLIMIKQLRGGASQSSPSFSFLVFLIRDKSQQLQHCLIGGPPCCVLNPDTQQSYLSSRSALL